MEKPSRAVGKIDADKYKESAERFKIEGYPTVKFFTNGSDEPYEGEMTEEAIYKYVM